MPSLQNRSLRDRIQRALVRNAPAKAVSLAVAVVVFFFVRTTSLEQRFVTVPLVARTAPRFTVTGGLPATATLTLRGKGDAIFRLSPEDIVVYVDLTENRNDGDYRVPLQFEKHGEAAVVEPLEITVEPLEVTATVEQVISRMVRVRPVFGAAPPTGFLLEGYEVDPPTVQVTGPRRRVQALQTLPTLPVDLSEVLEVTTLDARLDFDARAFTLPAGAAVKVVVTVRPQTPEAVGEPTEPVEPAS